MIIDSSFQTNSLFIIRSGQVESVDINAWENEFKAISFWFVIEEESVRKTELSTLTLGSIINKKGWVTKM